MDKNQIARQSLTLAALLALFMALPAQAHSPEESAVTAAAPAAVETIAGTVAELVIEDRVNNTTHSYHELQRDDGTMLSLTGTGAEALEEGARVVVRGRYNGTHFAVDEAQLLSPQSGPSAATKAANATQVEGTLAIAHADDFANGRSQYIYQVHDDAGSITTLSVAALPPELRGGMRVIVSGRRATAAGSLHPQRITILTAPAQGTEIKSGVIAKAATVNSVLVIMANFNNTAAPAYTAAQAQQVMSTNAYGVANYYSEVSYGQQLLNVTVTSTWVTMNLAASCDWSSIGPAAEAAALAFNPSYNAANYNFVVYLFPAQSSCGWSGLAYVGFPHMSWINGTGAFSTGTVAHEMGHNFGLYHAGSLNCGTASIGGSCNVAEYGDPWDTMGNQHAMHFNATQKLRLNWIPASSVQTQTSGSANYTLAPIEAAGGSLYAVRIPTASANRTYWIEFRQPVGFDSPSNPAANFSWPNNGAQIRVASPFEWSSGADDTEIVDMTPATSGNFTDSTLVVGQSFLDSTYGINIIVTGASASALTVNVTVSGGAATTTTLASSANPASVGANVTFTATVTGTNPTGSVNFKDGATSIAACSAVALTGSGNSRTAACTTNALAAGAHSIAATYSGDAANATSSSTALSQTVNATSTTGIGSSLNPSTAGTSVTFTATVSGTAPTGTVNFKDGATSIAGCTAAALTGSGNIRSATCATSSLTVGTHSISAVYSGDATNNGSTSPAFSQVVNNKVASTTSLASSANPSIVGASVTFTATVTGSAPTGSVGFTDGGSTIGGCAAVALPAGATSSKTATCSTSSLSATTHSIVATYGGDAANNGSASATLSQVVNSAATSSLVNPSFEIPALGSGYRYNPSGAGVGWTFIGNSGIKGNNSAFGGPSAPNGTQAAFIQMLGSMSQSVILNAGSYTLSFQGAQRSGQIQPVKVTLDGVQIGSLVSPPGTAYTAFSIPFSVATSGAHTIAFTGTDPNDKTTFIDSVTLTTAGASTTTTLVSSLNPSMVGTNVTFSATVTGSAPTGSVGFTDGGSTIGGCAAVALPAGATSSKTATCSTSSLSATTHSIVATYGGDAANNGSASATLSQVVNSAATSSLVNPSFEIPALGSGYRYNPSGAGVGWTFIGNSGIKGNNSAFGGPPAPNGTQAAFIQMLGSMSQSVILNAGSYTLSFQGAQRSGQIQPVKVTLDGVQIGSLVSPPGTAYTAFSIPFSVATSGAHTIAFTGTDPNDKTTFIDSVTVQ